MLGISAMRSSSFSETTIGLSAYALDGCLFLFVEDEEEAEWRVNEPRLGPPAPAAPAAAASADEEGSLFEGRRVCSDLPCAVE